MTPQISGRKQHLRRCIGCFDFKEKKDLIRLYKDDSGHIVADTSLKAGGRGAYICNDPDCVAKAKKRRALEHSFKMKLEESDYANILKSFTA